MPQTVTVTGVNDAVADGNIVYTIVTAPATSTDTVYNGIDAADVSVTNIDNNTVGIIVNPTAGLTTTEAGGTATFAVVLNSQPTADVTIGLSSSDTTEGTISVSSVTFTTANWNIPQTVTVTGVNDDLDDGDVGYTIVTAAATSSDGNYNGLNRQRRLRHQHRQRHGGHHRHADLRPDHDRSGRHGDLHGRAEFAADGGRHDRPELEQHGGRARSARRA